MLVHSQNEGRNTCASMPIHKNIAFLGNGIEDDIEEASLRLVALYQLIGIVSEVAEHIVLLDLESYVHPIVALLVGKTRFHAGEDLDIELQGLQRYRGQSKKR